jgi:hypothetical protein
MSDFDRNRDIDRNATPWGWIIGGLMALLVMIGAIYALGNRNDSSSASNNNGGTATRNDTTGSASGSGSGFSSGNNGTGSPATGSSTR